MLSLDIEGAYDYANTVKPTEILANFKLPHKYEKFIFNLMNNRHTDFLMAKNLNRDSPTGDSHKAVY